MSQGSARRVLDPELPIGYFFALRKRPQFARLPLG
jgi:hypothetical protein